MFSRVCDNHVSCFFAHADSREGRAGLANTFVSQGFSTDSVPRRGRVSFRSPLREIDVLLDLLVSPTFSKVLR